MSRGICYDEAISLLIKGFLFSNLVVDYKCVGVKSSSQTKANTLTTEAQSGDGKSLDAMKGLICGDTTAESEEVPGNPLKGFKITCAIVQPFPTLLLRHLLNGIAEHRSWHLVSMLPQEVS